MTTSDSVIFITGCTIGGIGAALCQVFANRGCTVYASARSQKSMEGESLSHPNIHKLLVDVTSDESVKLAVDEIYKQEGRIDVVISNAGLLGIGPLLDVPIDYIQSVMDTNFFGLVRLCKNIIPRMARSSTEHGRSKGLVVAIGSILGEFGTPWTGMYNASKAALHSYTETLEMECRPLGVNVMLVAPGGIVSNIANNAAKTDHEPSPDSLYKSFTSSITHVMFQSQKLEYGAMPTKDFALQLADYVVDKRNGKVVTNPARYVTMGGSTWVYKVFKWMPRLKVYDVLWNSLSKY
ncbi:hypothetical protein D9757_010004 [Collybiopsis confluens]|uniref:NAD(P)-binding protein n=1 Tax=Collybiopsis confluens TaxID=2823264 RepID=A0A8H5GUQ7_9AGAR|nr:hypothetical protein D9757_010004 [Collybiopsis confluens]